MTDINESDGHRVKRFKFQTYNAQLKDVHLPTTLSRPTADEKIKDDGSLFHARLLHWMQLNLSPSFLSFAQKTIPLCRSLPLLLHHWREVLDLWLHSVAEAGDEALRALFDLLENLMRDLRETLEPAYHTIMIHLLGFFPRNISPESLTILLGSLASVFKHLLRVSMGDDYKSFRSTWEELCKTVVKCKGETQRALSEVWAVVLRRLKKEDRQSIVILMLRSDEQYDIADFLSWCFVFTCKSIANTLQTAAMSVVLTCVDFYIGTTVAIDRSERVVRRLLTALIHHCSNAGQFAETADALILWFENMSKNTTDMNSVDRALRAISVPCSVRQGSRLTANHLSRILDAISGFDIAVLNEESFLDSVVASFVANSSDLTVWIGSCRRLLDTIWSSSNKKAAISLTGTLLECSWGGFKQFALPPFKKDALVMLNSDDSLVSLRVLRVLAGLADSKLFEDVDGELKSGVALWINNFLTELTPSEDSVLMLYSIASILPVVQSRRVIFTLGSLLQRLVTSETDSVHDYHESWGNEGWVTGCVLRLLVKAREDWLPLGFNLPEIIQNILSRWSWHDYVMSSLEKLVQSRYTDASASTSQFQQDTLVLLMQNLKSHSHAVRLSSLILLSSTLSPYRSIEVVKRCTTAEAVALSVQGIRERVLLVGRLGQFVNEGDQTAARICATWLLGQLKVNLRPIWSPSAQALASSASRFPETVWDLLIAELEASRERESGTGPSWMVDGYEEEAHGEKKEDERIWRDPSAFRLRTNVRIWISAVTCRNALIKEQSPRDRFDVVSYETQLLSALGTFASLAEKHGRQIVPLFMTVTASTNGTKAPRTRVSNWLSLFSKFANPKALPNASAVHDVFVSYLSHPDRAIQSISLSCLQTFKSPVLLAHCDSLRSLLDDTRWREEVTGLDLNSLSPNDRTELIPIIIRLFYGMMLERKGHGHGSDRRAALLSAVGFCDESELGLLVDLMTEPFSNYVRDGDEAWRNVEQLVTVPEKQQVGFLSFLGDVMKYLAFQIMPYWPKLLGVTITLAGCAQDKLDPAIPESDGHPVDDELGDDTADEKERVHGKALRRIRHLALKRLADFFHLSTTFDFTPFMPEVFRTIVTPRIPLFNQENTQAPSALLELFDIWSQNKHMAPYLVQFDSRTLVKIYDCLVATNVKPLVLTKIFDIIERLLAYAIDDDEMSALVVNPYMTTLLANFSTLVQQSTKGGATADALVHREIAILSELSPYISDDMQAATLLSLLLPQLRRSFRVVPEKVKLNMLEVVANLLHCSAEIKERESALYLKTYETLSFLFQALRGHRARGALISAFEELSKLDASLIPLARTLSSLNAYSGTRIDEPDFDRRLQAFDDLQDERCRALSALQWQPVLHNMLCFIQDENELSMRTNASSVMKRFLDVLSKQGQVELQTCFSRILLPGLKHCLRSKSDGVRSEVITVLAHGVRNCENIQPFAELRPLLAGGDEEVNFFNNICHVQVHRQIRALRRLGEYCDSSPFSNSVLREIFLPVVSNFILSAETNDHLLVNEAILTLGHVAKHLPWSAYYSLILQFMKLSTGQLSLERTFTRTLVALLDQFHFSLDESFTEEQDQDAQGDELVEFPQSTADPTMKSKIYDAVNDRLIPSLLRHLEQRNEMEDTNRILIAVGIVKVALHLPEMAREAQVDKLLTILSQILRSKSQETRDLTRETLCKIAISLGPIYLQRMIKRMREALLRGPHLHVLAFVTHSLLVHVTTSENSTSFSNVDDCISDAAHVSAEVIFGQSGKDVENEGFKTKMKEVRSSSKKGMDSFSILSKVITPAAIGNLLFPLKAIMHETESHRSMQLVDEVLRAIALGINSNPHFGPAELLTFCHTLITQNARFFQQHSSQKKPRKNGKRKATDAIVEASNPVSTEEGHYTRTSWRFVCFGLDLFSTAYKRNRFDFNDGNILSRLQPMVNVIGNTLYSSHGNVITHGLKATAQIVRCPLTGLDKSLPVFARQSLEIAKQVGSTDADIAQASLKTLAIMIRYCSSLSVKEKDLTFLLELLAPDLEEPARQATAFALLRAIIARKFVVPEIYDMMDRVAEIMVTSQSAQVQELCRGVLLQFLLDYPQGKGRLRQHFSFLVKNLSYTFEAGRNSVMELLNATILKFNDDIIVEYADMLFVGLVMVIANDESAKCREMSAQLIRSLFSRMKNDQCKLIISHVHTWSAQHSNLALSRVSSQIYGLLIDTMKVNCLPYLDTILEDVNDKIRLAAEQWDKFNTTDRSDFEEVDSLEWQATYQALMVLSKVSQIFPDVFGESEKIAWSPIGALLLYPHAWVRTASSRLLGSLFSITPVAPPKESAEDDFPLSLSGMKGLAESLAQQLKSEHLDEQLGLQVVKNLFYIGKCFYAKALESTDAFDATKNDEDALDSEDDEDAQEGKDAASDNNNLLPWLFSRLSYQVRSAYIARRNRRGSLSNWAQQPSAVFRWFAAMSSHMEGPHLAKYLPHILSPLHRVLEDDTVHDKQMEDLKSLGTEVQDLVREKVGSTEFSNVYSRIRQKIIGVRRERQTARVLLAAINPELAAKRRMAKHVSSKESKKRKTREFMSTKLRTKFTKRRKVD